MNKCPICNFKKTYTNSNITNGIVISVYCPDEKKYKLVHYKTSSYKQRK